jgi:hypothetical protein
MKVILTTGHEVRAGDKALGTPQYSSINKIRGKRQEQRQTEDGVCANRGHIVKPFGKRSRLSISNSALHRWRCTRRQDPLSRS